MKPTVPEWLAHLLHRPAAVLGAGVSGRAAAGLIRALGGEVVLYDRVATRPEERHFGAAEAARHGLVVLSPGFAPAHEWVRSARAAGCEVLGELDLAALAWPGTIIAVTGTNGKTTLTEFLAHALRLAGRDARAVGNTGAAFCEAWRQPATASSIAVCEVSSFQAETLRFLEASATLWTNFAEDHLERHGTMEAYFKAKYNLVRRTRDQVVFHGPDVRDFAGWMAAELPAAQAVDFAGEPVEPAVRDTLFGRLPQQQNYLMARALWRHLGLPADLLVRAASSFEVGPHRLARVAEAGGVTFWNDSKATNFHAAEAALASFAAPVLWIGGGRSKGGDVAAFVARIAPRVRQAFLIGETRDALAAGFRSQAVPVWSCGSLREATAQAFGEASAGDNILLSPAFASFDMFKGYDDRGRCFEAIVGEIAADRRARAAASLTFPNPSTARSMSVQP